MRLLHGGLKQSAGELERLIRQRRGNRENEPDRLEREEDPGTLRERVRERLAMFIAAMAVTLPPLILAGGLMLLLLWLFTHGF